MIRVLAPPTYAGMTKTVKTNARAEDRARWVALATGSAMIQRKDTGQSVWETIATYTKASGRVVRRP
jgi:hypothetical protein